MNQYFFAMCNHHLLRKNYHHRSISFAHKIQDILNLPHNFYIFENESKIAVSTNKKANDFEIKKFSASSVSKGN